MNKTIHAGVATIAFCLVLSGCYGNAQQAAAVDGDWPNFGRDGSEQHYSPLTEITAKNIDRLRLAWHYELEPGFTVSTPIAAEGKVFELPGDWPGGVLATAGDLVLQGRIDGQLVAYDAQTGKQVWAFKTPSPVVATPISYSVTGRQYVTVLTGSGSQGGGILATGNAAFRTDYRLPRHVLTFAIGGTDQLPGFEMPPLIAPADPDFAFDMEHVQRGGMAFAQHACLVCHGMNAIGGGAAPDLRYSPMIVDAAAFKAVVKDGALKLNGMPPSAYATDEDVEAIRTYLRALAQQTAAQRTATGQ